MQPRPRTITYPSGVSSPRVTRRRPLRRSVGWPVTVLGCALGLVVPSSSTAARPSTEQNIQDSLGTAVHACNAAGQPSSSASQITAVATYDSKAPPWIGQTMAMGVVIGTTHTTCLQDREGIAPVNAQRFGIELVLPRGAKLVTEAASPVTCQYGPKSTPCPKSVTVRAGTQGGVQLAYAGTPDGRFPLAPFTQARLSFRVRLTRPFNGLGKRVPSCGRLHPPCSPKELKRFAQVVVEDDERGIEPAEHSTVSPLLPLYALHLSHTPTRTVDAAALLNGATLRLASLPPKATMRARLRRGNRTIARGRAKAHATGGKAKLRLRPIASRRGAIRPGRRLRLRLTLTAPGVIRQTASSWIRVR